MQKNASKGARRKPHAFLRPPNRLHAEPLRKRSARQHAVLRKCAEEKNANEFEGLDAMAPEANRNSRPTTGARRTVYDRQAAAQAQQVNTAKVRPQTSEPPAAKPLRRKEAVGGMRCCRSVLKREPRQCSGAEREGCNTEPFACMRKTLWAKSSRQRSPHNA